ncbi:uncharacterized protein TNCV_4585861 [Trichonephila clavipes]|nr:uncharacterized protein TNCV_4585861 [Trichonephila clavipes]
MKKEKFDILVNLVLKENFIAFDQNLYKQIKGIPQGGPATNRGGDRGRVAIYRPFEEVSLSLNRTVTCMVLKANDRRTSCPCHDEFRGPRSDYVRQVALATTTTTTTANRIKRFLFGYSIKNS